MTTPDTTPANRPRLMTPTELAGFLQMDTERLSQMRSQGTGPRFLKLGRDIRYRWNDVREWLEENARTSTKAG